MTEQPTDQHAAAPTPIYSYQRTFQPTGPDGRRSLPAFDPEAEQTSGDRTRGMEYEFSEEIILAVNLAISTGRPLLISGNPGTGKSSLARSIARWMGWRFYEQVVTSRTQARDLLWSFDSLQRLADAQVASADPEAKRRLLQQSAYVKPGVLWWAFNPASAASRGAQAAIAGLVPITDPQIPLGLPPLVDWLTPVDRIDPNGPAVVLIDEIDKADPDVPNDLLVPLGAQHFVVAETETPVDLAVGTKPPLIVITNNRERELPPAFTRRCLGLELPDPGEQWLVKIARRRFGDQQQRLYELVAKETLLLRAAIVDRAPPGTAEFIDTVRACLDLHITPEHATEWPPLQQATLLKWRSQQR